MKLAHHGLTLLYALALVVCALVPWSPRVFWTMLMPLVPIGILVMGFHTWRRACPIAAFGALGSRVHNLSRRKRRRLSHRWRSVTFVVPLAMFVLCLGGRLVATNGDPLALSLFLGSLAAGAFLFNALFGGRSFCHYLCPVGVVERIYTDGAARAEKNSACDTCTGCATACVDINRTKSYERSAYARGRRIATYTLPGIVLAFYLHFFLRAGNWEAYFDGRWTSAPWSAARLTAPGYFFAPNIPDVAASFITLLAGAFLSYVLFALVERHLSDRLPDPTTRRHRVLSIASFAAFNLFYLFAGAPTLRKAPWLASAFACAVPVVATVILVQRWKRPTRQAATRKHRLVVI